MCRKHLIIVALFSFPTLLLHFQMLCICIFSCLNSSPSEPIIWGVHFAFLISGTALLFCASFECLMGLPSRIILSGELMTYDTLSKCCLTYDDV
uniref:Uncharacterized protein n=1 Tax=Arundo donax TaxID=35708 RepID=A0A0A8XR09_ARUDO